MCLPGEKPEGKCSVFGLYRNFLPRSMYSDMKRWLVDNPNYQEGDKNEPMTIPRTQIWYQKDGQYFCPRWKGVFQRWCSVKYDSTLERLQSIVQNYTDKTVEKWNSCHPPVSRIQKPDINSCLVNRYRSGADSIKPHRDSRIVLDGHLLLLVSVLVLHEPSSYNQPTPHRIIPHWSLNYQTTPSS